MKKTSQAKSKRRAGSELRAEYRFDYTRAKPNRFAKLAQPGCVAIVLDPDVAKVFQDAESVNRVLRALVSTMPRRRVG